jgi:aminoglycoside phosphotransferase family enzyme
MSTAAFPVQTADIVDLLKNPSAYPDSPRTVQVIETHISWVFLTDRHAYKLKKPVRYDFLDFSTAERRYRACQDEIRLNRRLAPDVYDDVLPVTRDSRGLLELDGQGQEVDWVVKMRRLPARSALDVA